ncbi:MAG: hypothetical protein QS748_00890 [Candidatus Endonucleobacter bathymodioli]|uniref:Uncharacterized protein n=1 Tax=Candidatus Endonucleibacter bathymodioli TaxID=539814 RepID=A0AA90NVX0_9GAMM|nr:hypothetical protein [Candidatus Endonucleobacter bathymodioli]
MVLSINLALNSMDGVPQGSEKIKIEKEVFNLFDWMTICMDAWIIKTKKTIFGQDPTYQKCTDA